MHYHSHKVGQTPLGRPYPYRTHIIHIWQSLNLMHARQTKLLSPAHETPIPQSTHPYVCLQAHTSVLILIVGSVISLGVPHEVL